MFYSMWEGMSVFPCPVKKSEEGMRQYLDKGLAFLSRYCKIKYVWNDTILGNYVLRSGAGGEREFKETGGTVPSGAVR